MTTAHFRSDVFTPVAQGLTPLQRAISTRTLDGRITYYADDAPTLNAPLASIAAAVESAYILTAKDELPNVTEGNMGTLSVDGFGAFALIARTAESARKRAAAWLAVAQYLDVKEKAKAYEEAKAKAVADAMTAAAEAARTARLDELADEWFGKDDFADLGPNKAAAVKEIYRLETELNAKDAA